LAKKGANGRKGNLSRHRENENGQEITKNIRKRQ
jgi:hypothetical protein